MSVSPSTDTASQSTNRENPFNRELIMDDTHFASSQTASRQSSQSTNVSQPAPNIIDWDFGGLIESPNTVNSMGLTRMEELNLAIDECKTMILACDDQSDKRRKLVARLVQLRLQLQDLKDGAPVAIEDGLKTIAFHHFIEQDRSGRNPYCEKCMGIVWRLVQPWYRCKDCGYRAHAKCLTTITRVCAAQKFRENPTYILTICPERGLADQKYRCTDCRTKISFDPPSDGSSVEARLCDYTGLYFCPSCHWNDTVVIPARVVHNWDFTPQLVSRSSKQLLEIMSKKPLIKLETLNPTLWNFITDLRTIKKMRLDILLMKCYFMCCRAARKQRILWNLKRHQHFVEGSEIYSLRDLIELHDGRLEAEMRSILLTFIQHIRKECVTCSGNGFVCELCADKSIIFPFDESVATCRLCYAVFHRYNWYIHSSLNCSQCLSTAANECPRCARRLKRQAMLAHNEDEDNTVDNEDKHNSNTPKRTIDAPSLNPFE